MKTHEVTIYDPYVDAILNGTKTLVIRLQDKGYQKGDRLKFRVAQFIDGSYQSHLHKQEYEITHVHSGLEMGWNYVGLTIEAAEGDK